MIPDALGTCYHALVRRAKVKRVTTLSSWVGVEDLGLHALQIAKWLGAVVIGVDVSAEKLELMKAYGAGLCDRRTGDPSWSKHRGRIYCKGYGPIMWSTSLPTNRVSMKG